LATLQSFSFFQMTARRLPFGIKAPSRGTVIFGSVVAGISGVVYASNYYVSQARQSLFDRVTFLADRPLGVHVRFRSLISDAA
jgi:hypothetical protein